MENVLAEFVHKDIARYISHLVFKMYLDDWTTQIRRVNVDFKRHIGCSFQLMGDEMIFDGLCWNNYEGEDPEEYNHDYDGNNFNFRDLKRTYNLMNNNDFINNLDHYHRLVHIAHVPTQRLTNILLPKNY